MTTCELQSIRNEAEIVFSNATKNMGFNDNARSTFLRELLNLPKLRFVTINTMSAVECRYVIKKYTK
jgi:hypothetical protein